MDKQRELEAMEFGAKYLVDKAAFFGLIVTIEQKPLEPLAMGNYESVVSVRPKRNSPGLITK